MRTFVLANICSVGEKSKISRFICKNNIFKILLIKTYHSLPPHYTTTYHYHNPTSPKTTNHNKITPSTTTHNLPTTPPYKTIKPTNLPLPQPTTTKKTYKIKHYTTSKSTSPKNNYKNIHLTLNHTKPHHTLHKTKQIHPPTTHLQNKNINPPPKIKKLKIKKSYILQHFSKIKKQKIQKSKIKKI